jgi:carbonic anhydrase
MGLLLGAVALLLPLTEAQAWQTRLSEMTTAKPQWSYAGERGPSAWADLDPAYLQCATGRLQSPVPLETRAAIFRPCVPLRFRYRSTSLRLVNDGKALRLGYDRGSFLVIDGLSYELVEVRFHVPGEHAIDGVIPDAEIELIHGNNRGDVTILSVPVESGQRVNQTFRRILQHAPTVSGTQAYGRNIGVNALFLLPARRSYFRYQGSTTRPPCEEGVERLVLDTPLEIERSDLARLAQLVGDNARPLQPLRERLVERVCASPND